MKAYRGFNVLTNKTVGYFSKEEAEKMAANPVYKSISFVNETPKSDEKEKETTKARKQGKEKQEYAKQAEETLVTKQPKKKTEKVKE